MALEKRDPSPADPEKTGLASRGESIKASTVLEHSHDADEAMKAFSEHQGKIEIDEATNKRLLRRIDWNLMPLMCVIYGLNYLDKTTLSYASIMGIKEDIGLKGDNYQWLSSMFYFGYLAWEVCWNSLMTLQMLHRAAGADPSDMQYPTNRLLQRLPLAKYSAFCVILCKSRSIWNRCLTSPVRTLKALVDTDGILLHQGEQHLHALPLSKTFLEVSPFVSSLGFLKLLSLLDSPFLPLNGTRRRSKAAALVYGFHSMVLLKSSED